MFIFKGNLIKGSTKEMFKKEGNFIFIGNTYNDNIVID